MKKQILCAVTILWFCATSLTPCEEPTTTQERLLIAQGIGTTSSQLTLLLEKGLPTNARETNRGASLEPIHQAWSVLSRRRQDIRNHNPALMARLSKLAVQFTRREPPQAILDMLDKDLLVYAPHERIAPRRRHLDMIQYNGMIALALFGAPSEENIELAHRTYLAEKRPLVRIIYARTAGILGDTTVLDILVSETGKQERMRAVTASKAIYVLTGNAFPLHKNLAIEPRYEVAREILR